MRPIAVANRTTAKTARYVRRYALALVAGLLLAFVAFSGHTPVPASAAVATGDCTPASDWPAANGTLAAQVLALVNQHRAAMSLPQLVTSPTLTASAVWKARHMAAYGYLAHDDPAPPVARTAADRIATCGYTASWGENIAAGYTTAQSVFDAWLASPGHRANIENASFHATGIGAASSSAGILWAQDFGTTVDGSAPPPTTTASPPTTAPPPPTTTPTTTAAPPPTTTARTTTTAPPATTTAPPATTTAPPATTAPAPSKSPAATVAIVLSRPSVRVSNHRLTLRIAIAAPRQISRAAPIKVKCSASVQARHLRVVVNAYRGGKVRCAWRYPASLAGHDVHGWVRVRQAGVQASRSFAAPLR